ncbi:MAK10-like protein [Tanacetum coccineum]|uniref:MAK10-like protein n=1 Tax=Tanacetum coccineum TaxID=301880 RepID=A0ABQ5H7G5_9ASTR
MERFENFIFKQRDKINDRMAEMLGLLKELTTSRTPKKILIREEARHLITKNVNSISIIKMIDKSVMEPGKPDKEEPPKGIDMKNEVERKTDDKSTKSARGYVKKNEEDEPVGGSSSHTGGYYLKHRINEKLIEGLLENHRFNDSMSATRVGKAKRKTYNLLPKGPMHNTILKKKITRKEDIGGNFEIPCNVGRLKDMNVLVGQGSEVNVMPFSIYNKLTDERPAETYIRLSLASNSYIYLLGIVKDLLVDIAGYVYPVDFMTLNMRGDKKRPFILGTPFLTTAKVVIKFNKGTITLRSGKSKISFYKIPEPYSRIEKGIKNDIEPIAPTMTVNKLVLE